MAGTGKERKPDAFLSYARLDDQVSDGYISWLREKLEGQVNAEIGKGSFWIFQDTDEIPAGANWASALDDALAGARFLIPILSPSYFASQPCLFELAKFHGFESISGRKDLIIPIYFRDAPDHWNDPNNPNAALLRERQLFDWRPLRRKRRDDPEVLEHVERLASDIKVALLRTAAAAHAAATPVTIITGPEALAAVRQELAELRAALDNSQRETMQARQQLVRIEQTSAQDKKRLEDALTQASSQATNAKTEIDRLKVQVSAAQKALGDARRAVSQAEANTAETERKFHASLAERAAITQSRSEPAPMPLSSTMEARGNHVAVGDAVRIERSGRITQEDDLSGATVRDNIQETSGLADPLLFLPLETSSGPNRELRALIASAFVVILFLIFISLGWFDAHGLK
jgi:hypothetical protein